MSFRSGLLVGLTTLALLVAPTAAAEPLVEPLPPVTSMQAPVIVGEARVGLTLSVTPPAWSPDDAATTYQWLRSDVPISDATDAAYTLTVADLGSPIAVQATGTKDGYTPAEVISEPTQPVTPGLLTLVQPPTITGLARVGTTLSVNPPVWSEDGLSISYQWRRDNLPVSTRAQYTLTSKDVGARISVVATETKPGYDAAAAESAATAVVTKIPATVTVRGSSTRVGALRLSITVSAPGEPAPSGSVSLKRGTTVLKARLPLTSGRASYTATGIKPGRYTYTVRYAGSSRIAEDTGSTAVQIKAKTRPSISLTPTTSVGKVRLGITVTAAGQPPLGGTAYVKEGSRTLKSTITIVRGKASFSASGVKSGRHTYLVGYRGTSQVSSGTKSITVRVPAPVKLVSYPDCTALRKVHPHGVGRSGAKDKTGGTPVTTFLVNTKLYEYNDGQNDKPGERDLDRDNDGVACEQH